MGPRCSSAETQVCHRSYIIAASLCVCFIDSCFVLFLFGHCVVCSSSIYGFCLPLWYLQTLLTLSPCLIYEICFPKSSNQNTIYFIGSPYDVLIGCFLDNEHNILTRRFNANIDSTY